MKKKKFLSMFLLLVFTMTLFFSSILTVFAADDSANHSDDDFYYDSLKTDSDGLYLYTIDLNYGVINSSGDKAHLSIILKSKNLLGFYTEYGTHEKLGEYTRYFLRTGIRESNDKFYSQHIPSDYTIDFFEYQIYDKESELISSCVSIDDMEVGFSLTSFTVFSGGKLGTNIPIFSSNEAYINYVLNGDDSDVINKKPVPETDDSFAFVNFDVNEYVSATWTGTTFDSISDTFDSMSFEIKVGYAYIEHIGQIATTEVIEENGDLKAKSWKKRFVTLAHNDKNLYVRYVSFTPTYTDLGQVCRGKSEVIWFDPEGNKDYLPEGDLTMKEDSSFYLKGVSVEDSSLGIIDAHVRSYISWTGTTKDYMIAKVPLDKTYADILVLCYTNGYKPTYIDIYDLNIDFMGGEVLRLRKSSTDSSQAFYLDTTSIFKSAEAQGLTFSGKVYITPYFFYEYDNVIYKGVPTVLNLYDNVIDDNPEGNPIPSPSQTPSASPPPDSGIELTPDNSLDYVWNLLKSLLNSLGMLPQFFEIVFPFLPGEFSTFLIIFLVVVIILRIMGR